MEFHLLASRLIPRKIKLKIRELLGYSIIELSAEELLGFILLYSFSASLFFATLLMKFLPFPLTFLFFFLGFWLLSYIWILLTIDRKARYVEEVLPDALQLMSSNIRAGITTDRALLMSARPEFGPFAEEIRRVGREIMTGRDLTSSLKKITHRTKSDTLAKTVDLIIVSIKAGGELADVLDQISSDLREEQIIQKEISASVLMYVLFIFIAITLASPLLFAMSSFLVTLLRENIGLITTQIPKEQMKSAPISMGSMQLPQYVEIFGNKIPFLTFYSFIAMFFSSLFGSLILGLILSGNERAGIKYFPLMFIIAIGLYLAGGWVLDTFFGEMMRV